MPFEIQQFLKLPPSKIHWSIPEDAASQGTNVQRLRSEFYKNHLFPNYNNLGILDYEKVHEFDEEFLRIFIDFVYQGKSRSKRMVNEVEGFANVTL